MEFHEVCNFRVGFDLPCGFHGLSPGVVHWSSSFSPFPWVSSMLQQVTPLLVTDEALSVSDMLGSFSRREIDFVYVHSIGICSGGSVSWWDVAVSPSSKFPESHHILVEFPGLV